MSLFHCHFSSAALRQQVQVNVILPQRPAADRPAGGYKTLYLLHGLSDDHNHWIRQTSIERYAAEYPDLAIAMPAVHRSFYQDMRLGMGYWTYVSEELPALLRAAFPLSAAREDNFAAGLSMGGYGAFQLGLRRPGNYAAVASLSGALDLPRRYKESLAGTSVLTAPECAALFDPATGVPAESDLFALLEKARADGTELPRLYQACGTEDFLWEDNVNFRDHAQKLAVPLTWEQGPGAHNWAYWDTMIQKVLAWLNVRDAPPVKGAYPL